MTDFKNFCTKALAESFGLASQPRRPPYQVISEKTVNTSGILGEQTFERTNSFNPHYRY